ncbi:Ribonuclease P protein subunit p29 [Microtus ochrogaster]|uniref:Ribonuclease P protein subunit p29 n=1 Tax=Microtus ochrogaster TaxID=79684 RepID=A0A8J6GBY4_MICOH|nr:Ribonuclease P protein subunit p29 [Microtus ochrogaster]
MNHALHEHERTVYIVPHTFSFLLFHSVITKLNCVFTIEIDGFISYIYRSNFQLWSSERSAKKFKVKGTIDL